jgi:hypothetical protein
MISKLISSSHRHSPVLSDFMGGNGGLWVMLMTPGGKSRTSQRSPCSRIRFLPWPVMPFRVIQFPSIFIILNTTTFRGELSHKPIIRLAINPINIMVPRNKHTTTYNTTKPFHTMGNHSDVFIIYLPYCLFQI